MFSRIIPSPTKFNVRYVTISCWRFLLPSKSEISKISKINRDNESLTSTPVNNVNVEATTRRLNESLMKINHTIHTGDDVSGFNEDITKTNNLAMNNITIAGRIWKTLQTEFHKNIPLQKVVLTKREEKLTSVVPPLSSPLINQPKVVIIGAGIAGLSSAQTLIQNGLKNLVLIEASDRYGGRIATKNFGDMEHCEMGTSVLDFNPDNENPNLTQPWLEETAFIGRDGKQIEPQITKEFLNDFSKVLKEVTVASALVNDNLYNALSSRLEPRLKKVPNDKRMSATKIFCSVFQKMRGIYGTDLVNINSKISLKGLARHSEVMPWNGCSNFLAPLVDLLPVDALRLGVPIGRIEWKTGNSSNEPRIFVRALNGETFPADYVIVTLPLGVMKFLGESLFDPPLPPTRQWSTERIGIGTVEKVFLEFEGPIDEWFRGPFTVAFTPIEMKDHRHWTSGISKINRGRSKHVLEIPVAGNQAAEMSSLPEERVASDIQKVLATFFPFKKIPAPKSIMRSDWSKNARFLGSHVYPSVLTDMNHVEDQQKPLFVNAEGPMIFFAGDSTADAHLLGTVMGARLSGIREATKIVKLTQKQTENRTLSI